MVSVSISLVGRVSLVQDIPRVKKGERKSLSEKAMAIYTEPGRQVVNPLIIRVIHIIRRIAIRKDMVKVGDRKIFIPPYPFCQGESRGVPTTTPTRICRVS